MRNLLIGLTVGLLIGSIGVATAFDFAPLQIAPPVFVTPAPIIIPPYPNSYTSLPPLPHAHFGADPCY